MRRDDFAKRLGAAAVAEPRDAVIEEREPERFIARFTEAVAAGGTVFLADPAWGESERRQFNALVAGPARGDAAGSAGRTLPVAQAGRGPGGGAFDPSSGRGDATPVAGGWLCIPTGGSSGGVNLARHDESTLWAAVQGFAAHFHATRIDAVGLLPLHHVSGLMAWLRCILTGGRYRPWDWKRLEAGERPACPGGGFVSLVPTQLHRLLDQPGAVEWLRGFRAILLGGGPAWPELLAQAAEAQLPLAPSYGATETAAMVAALRPGDFLAGGRGCGSALPHARVSIAEDGSIEVEASSLFRGYWPGTRDAGPWRSGDVGMIDGSGSLHVRGRRDALIISGGEKIDPAEVEAALRATGHFADVAVVGGWDPRWGQIVVACHPPAAPAPDRRQVEEALAGRLAKFKWPKRYLPIHAWPRNEQGKVRRSELVARVGEILRR